MTDTTELQEAPESGLPSHDLLAVVDDVEYYWRRSNGWMWLDGRERWWEVFVVFNGMNGSGGACIEERWRWNGSGETMRRQPRNLSPAETVALLRDLSANATVQAIRTGAPADN